MSIAQFRDEPAVNIAVAGNYKLANWLDSRGKLRTYACRTARVSPYRMMVAVPVVGKIGHRITSYFRDFGQLDGVISDTTAGGFLCELEMTAARREKFASQLAWLETRKKDPGIPDARADARFIPANPHAALTLADGTTQRCFVIDMSVSGVSVSADLEPELALPLAIGACVGRVVRHFDDGFAVKFVDPQNRDDLERLIACFAPPA